MVKDINKLSTEESLAELMNVKGIGMKVASCILLFGYKRLDVFPIDTWVRQYMVSHYDVVDNQKEIESIILSQEKNNVLVIGCWTERNSLKIRSWHNLTLVL